MNRFDVNRLNDPEVKSKLSNTFMSNIISRAKTDSAISENSSIFDILSDVAVQVVGKVPPQRPRYHSSNLREKDSSVQEW